MLNAGYMLVRPVPRQSWMSQELLPETIVSASACICPRFPDAYAIEWVHDDNRDAGFDAVGLAPHLRREAVEWATAAFEDAYGWPCVFYTAASARAARDRFFPGDAGIRLIGLGLPEAFAASFLAATTPPPRPPEFAPMGESGFFQCVKRHEELPLDARVIGFEVVNVDAGAIGHSWLCNGLETHCAGVLGIRPASNGLLASMADATRCRDEIDREEVGAEPGPWYPLLLWEP